MVEAIRKMKEELLDVFKEEIGSLRDEIKGYRF